MWNLSGKKNEQELAEKHLTAMYRETFLTYNGKKVLDDILRFTLYFDTIDPNDVEQAALSNVGKLIMSKLGIVSDRNTLGIIEALSGISPEE